jgi:hypothetical protein
LVSGNNIGGTKIHSYGKYKGILVPPIKPSLPQGLLPGKLKFFLGNKKKEKY